MNVICPSRDEHSTRHLSLENLQSATQGLWEDGCIVLENVVSPQHLAVLHERMRADLETILARPDAPFNFNAGNVQQDPPPFPPFLFADVLLNEFVIQVSNAVLGPRPRLALYSGNTALPGGERQPVHPDTGQLWPALAHPTPAFCLVVNVPLVDVDERNGATEFWPGTHHDTTFSIHEGAPRIEESRLATWRASRPPFQAAVQRGDIVMRDIRMWHAGMPNRSTEPRPMLAMTHNASWLMTSPVRFAREAEPFLSHPNLQIHADFVEGEVDYLHHGAAYDFQE